MHTKKGTDQIQIPGRIHARPVRKPGPIVAAVIVAIFVAMLIHGMVTNPNFDWPTVWKYLFNEHVLDGIKWTLLLTVYAMVLATILAIILAVMRKSFQSGAALGQLVLHLVLPWHSCVHPAGLLGPAFRVDS